MTLAMEKLAERDGIPLGAETLRRWLWAFYADMYTMYQSLASQPWRSGAISRDGRSWGS